jgi:hypothetical protein
VIAAGTDVTVAPPWGPLAGLTFTRTTSGSDCPGILNGFAGSFTSGSVDYSGADVVIDLGSGASNYAVAGTALSLAPASACIGGAVITTTVNSGTLGAPTANDVTLDITFSIDADGC